MFRPISLFVGLRYTRSDRRHHFISFISMMSILGIAFGVTVLITILSVLNGFDREIKKSIFSMISPLTITYFNGSISNWQQLEHDIAMTPGVTAVAPLVSGQVLLQSSNETQPVMAIGIDPVKENAVTALSHKLIAGQYDNLKPNALGIILGKNLAEKLGVNVGDSLIAVSPKGNVSTQHFNANFKRFIVTGIFHAGGGGGFSFDSKLAYMHLSDAQKIFDLNHSITALHASVHDLYAAPLLAKTIENELSTDFRVANWTEQLGDFFENIKLTKSILFLIFVLIIVVAVFNLIATLVMVVNNKQSDIAILRTMGATPKTIMMIFIIQGAIIGAVGILLGVLGGITLSLNVTQIVDWIQRIFDIQLISSNLYFVNYLPSEVQWSDVWKICALAFFFSLLATIRPALNAAKTEPVDALRYE